MLRFQVGNSVSVNLCSKEPRGILFYVKNQMQSSPVVGVYTRKGSLTKACITYTWFMLLASTHPAKEKKNRLVGLDAFSKEDKRK